MSARVFVALVVLATLGCEKKPAPAPSDREPGTTPAAQPSGTLPRPTTHGGAQELKITWQDVPGLTRLNQQKPMRAASYAAPAAEGDKEPGDLGVFYFGADQGGGVERNMKRWIDQFPDVPKDQVRRSQRTENGLLVHVVEIEGGKFESGMPGGPKTPKESYGLLGAIIEAPSGLYFFKLTGPQGTVKKARDPFFKMLATVKAK
ncbi:MAG TPA: hypothetical protein PKA88_06855 [Polyangiaceae bacterium]|nr:hypothetical protein [Polyangiaceae bacterium]HMR75625.1 hypothetical protein [Polyangiaceae bacterium]